MVNGMMRTVATTVLSAMLMAAAPAIAHERHQNDAARDRMTRHWQERLNAAVGSAVSVAADEKGVLWLARMENGHVWISRSDDGGKRFAHEVKVNPEPEAILADGQNRPKVVAGGGVIAVTWAQALPRLHTGHVRFARSIDGGRTYSAPVTVNDDLDEIGHSFGTLALSDTGRLALVWLDGRERAAALKRGGSYRGSSVQYVLSNDRGATFTPNRKLADHSCECCRIGLAFDPEGEAVAQWRHVFGDNIRDFAMAPLRADSTIVRASHDDWQISACPHHGGDLDIDEGGRRHLVWFTGSPKGAGIYYRFADGARMSMPLALGNPDAQAGNPTVFARNGRVTLAWREFDGARYRVLAQHSADRGSTWSEAREVAVAEKSADLPLFVAGARTPLLAWYADGEVRIFDLRAAP
jgi:hypothetical protein